MNLAQTENMRLLRYLLLTLYLFSLCGQCVPEFISCRAEELQSLVGPTLELQCNTACLIK